MQGIRLNRNLIKVLHKQGQDMEDYRFYVMARSAFSFRSGIFSLEEFCGLLYSKYGYKSLHKGPGNKRKRYINQFNKRFSGSILFKECPDGRFVACAERKILKKYTGTDKSSWYELTDDAVLQSKGQFRDFCVGMLLSGNKFRSNKNIAEFCGCTVRRIQKATSTNHARKIFVKQYNFIDDYTGPKKMVELTRAELFRIHGINSPRPVKYNDEWVLRLNAPNSYRSFVLSGVKGFNAQPPRHACKSKECWFRPVRQPGIKQLKLYGDEYKRWVFKQEVYDLNRYIQDNSRYLNG